MTVKYGERDWCSVHDMPMQELTEYDRSDTPKLCYVWNIDYNIDGTCEQVKVRLVALEEAANG